MTQNPGATTRTVQPTPQFDSMRGAMLGYESMQPSLSIQERELLAQRYGALLETLTDTKIGQVSLSPHEQRLAAAALDLSDDGQLNDSWFTSVAADETPSAERYYQTGEKLSPQAKRVRSIEQQTGEQNYQLLVETTPVVAWDFRQYGLKHPERIAQNIQDDYVLAA